MYYDVFGPKHKDLGSVSTENTHRTDQESVVFESILIVFLVLLSGFFIYVLIKEGEDPYHDAYEMIHRPVNGVIEISANYTQPIYAEPVAKVFHYSDENKDAIAIIPQPKIGDVSGHFRIPVSEVYYVSKYTDESVYFEDDEHVAGGPFIGISTNDIVAFSNWRQYFSAQICAKDKDGIIWIPLHVVTVNPKNLP